MLLVACIAGVKGEGKGRNYSRVKEEEPLLPSSHECEVRDTSAEQERKEGGTPSSFLLAPYLQMIFSLSLSFQCLPHRLTYLMVKLLICIQSLEAN